MEADGEVPPLASAGESVGEEECENEEQERGGHEFSLVGVDLSADMVCFLTEQRVHDVFRRTMYSVALARKNRVHVVVRQALNQYQAIVVAMIPWVVGDVVAIFKEGTRLMDSAPDAGWVGIWNALAHAIEVGVSSGHARDFLCRMMPYFLAQNVWHLLTEFDEEWRRSRMRIARRVAWVFSGVMHLDGALRAILGELFPSPPVPVTITPEPFSFLLPVEDPKALVPLQRRPHGRPHKFANCCSPISSGPHDLIPWTGMNFLYPVQPPAKKSILLSSQRRHGDGIDAAMVEAATTRSAALHRFELDVHQVRVGREAVITASQDQQLAWIRQLDRNRAFRGSLPDPIMTQVLVDGLGARVRRLATSRRVRGAGDVAALVLAQADMDKHDAQALTEVHFTREERASAWRGGRRSCRS